MKIPFNDLSRAARAQAADLAAVFGQVADSGWFVHGPHHRRFEADLAAYLGVRHVTGVASGTDALEIAIRALTPDAGRDVVVTVANAGGYTSSAAVAAGRRVRFCDVDPATHTMDPAALESVLDEEVGAVVVTHLYGRMADVPSVRRICDPAGVPVIEDCAQSLGARGAAGMAGSLGAAATFSFYPTKNLGALGDGGAIATQDDEVEVAVRELRQYGWDRKYHNARTQGRNSRLDELQAAFLSQRLPALDRDNAQRREIVSAYARSAPAGVSVLPADGEHHVAHLAVVVTDDAGELAAYLAEHGVATDVHYPTPDHRQPAWSTGTARLPVTEGLVGRVLSLPCFPELTAAEVDHVCTALSSYGGR